MEKSSTTKAPEKSRLGRGLSALIPPTPRAAAPERHSAAPPPAAAPETVQEVPLASIATNPNQPRTEFDEAALAELTDSVREHGVLQPVMVRPRGKDRYELVAGERRYRAAERAGLTRIPVVVRDLSDKESLTVALIENIQREDLNPLEAAHAYKQLMDDYALTQAELGRLIGKKQSTISNSVSLLKLPQEIQDSLAQGRLTTDHARELLSVRDRSVQIQLWQDFLALNMGRKDAREHVRAAKVLTGRPRAAATKDSNWKALEERFTQALAVKTELTQTKAGITLTVKCPNQEVLEGILEKIHT